MGLYFHPQPLFEGHLKRAIKDQKLADQIVAIHLFQTRKQAIEFFPLVKPRERNWVQRPKGKLHSDEKKNPTSEHLITKRVPYVHLF